MNCKNCNETLEKDAHFCDNCGAKVITNRITFRFLMIELFAVLGFDSLFFNTLKRMIFAPHLVIKEYLEGVRKRYLNPFAYLAIGAALSLIIFNYFSEDYKNVQIAFYEEEMKEIEELSNKDLTTIKDITDKELARLKRRQETAKKQLVFIEEYSGFMLRYFNIATFLFIPFYSLLSKLTYRKPYNYGEHIVINAYIQGSTLYFMIISFLLSIVINPGIFSASLIFTIFYYLYVFSKLNNLTIKQSLLKFLRFLIVLAIILLIIFIITLVITVIILIVNKFINT